VCCTHFAAEFKSHTCRAELAASRQFTDRRRLAAAKKPGPFHTSRGRGKHREDIKETNVK